MSLLLFNNDQPGPRRRTRLTPGVAGAAGRTSAVLIAGAITFAAVFVVAALVADSVSKGAARTYYGLAAQILTVFLVALALEQSLSERLAAEGDFAADVADREASRLRDRRGEVTATLERLLSL